MKTTLPTNPTKKQPFHNVINMCSVSWVPWNMIHKMKNGVNGICDHHTRKETGIELLHCEDEGISWYMIAKMEN